MPPRKTHTKPANAALFTFIALGFSTVTADLVWHEAKNFGTSLLHGKAAYATGEQTLNYYNRLPASAINTTRPSIWGLSQQPAGLFLQFSTNSTTVKVRYTLGSKSIAMWHFASTGVSGMDCYAWDEGNATWRWTGTSKPEYPLTIATLASTRTAEMRKYRIHLPTYNRVADDLSIGTSHHSHVPHTCTCSCASLRTHTRTRAYSHG
jgi:hypothetical protein